MASGMDPQIMQKAVRASSFPPIRTPLPLDGSPPLRVVGRERGFVLGTTAVGPEVITRLICTHRPTHTPARDTYKRVTCP